MDKSTKLFATEGALLRLLFTYTVVDTYGWRRQYPEVYQSWINFVGMRPIAAK